jgi:hypothetical protein
MSITPAPTPARREDVAFVDGALRGEDADVDRRGREPIGADATAAARGAIPQRLQ